MHYTGERGPCQSWAWEWGGGAMHGDRAERDVETAEQRLSYVEI